MYVVICLTEKKAKKITEKLQKIGKYICCLKHKAPKSQTKIILNNTLMDRLCIFTVLLANSTY